MTRVSGKVLKVCFFPSEFHCCLADNREFAVLLARNSCSLLPLWIARFCECGIVAQVAGCAAEYNSGSLTTKALQCPTPCCRLVAGAAIFAFVYWMLLRLRRLFAYASTDVPQSYYDYNHASSSRPGGGGCSWLSSLGSLWIRKGFQTPGSSLGEYTAIHA